MDTLVAGREIAAGGGYGGELGASRGAELDFGADGVAIAFVTDEFEREPVIGGDRFVAKDVSGAIVGGNHGVDTTIIVQVTGSQSAADPGLLKDFSGTGGHVHKAVPVIAEQEKRLAIAEIGIAELDSVEIVALGNQEVLPAVIVVVEKNGNPAGVRHADLSQTGGEAGIVEGAIAIVLIQSIALIGKVGDEKVRPAVVIVVGEVDAHAGKRTTVAVHRDL